MPSERQLFLQHVAQTSPFPLSLEIEKAKGVYMYGKNGKKYLDLISGIGVSNVGHRHPKVISAVKKQLNKHLHLMVYGEFVDGPQVKLATKLASTLPDPLETCYFLNSGSEAIEGAVKLAKRYTGRSKVVSLVHAYHGSSHLALSLSGTSDYGRKFAPLVPGIERIRQNNIEDLAQIDGTQAAVLIETVQGEAGVRLSQKNWLKKLRKKCSQTGTLLILDEIQCGFGRTGSFWAFEQYGIQPDILVTAKGMGGGLPIGAFISSREIMSCLSDNPILGHISTFGGNAVSCSASLATATVLTDSSLIDEVHGKAALFKKYLKHKEIREVRHKGLLMAVEFSSFEYLQKLIENALDLGLLSDWFLFCDNSMRIAPPLIITEKQIKKACETILKAIELTKV